MRWLLTLVSLSLYFGGFAQVGGNNTFEFLNLPASARAAALGGDMVAVKDRDVNMGHRNPALLNPEMDHQLALNTVLYYAGINYGYAGFAKDYDSLGIFSGGIQYINYGKFTSAQPNGNITGNFYAGETALQVGWGRTQGRFSYGASFKLVGSFMESYSAFGAGIDIAGAYQNPEKKFIVTGVLKNLGTQFKAYRPGNTEPFPLEIQVGASKELLHVPLRLFVTAHNLQQYDLRYETSSTGDNTLLADSTSQQQQQPKQYEIIADQFFRHLIFGAEFTIADVVKLRASYNYLRRQELTIDNGRKGMVGFAFGAAVDVSDFHIGYGRSLYHLAGGTNHFTFMMNIDDVFRKKVQKPPQGE